VKFINASKAGAKLIINTDNVGMAKWLNGSMAKKIKSDITFIKFDDSYINQHQNIFDNLQIFGEQNVKNAGGVLKLAEVLNIPTEKVKQAFSEFRGTKRRMDLVGEAHGIKLYDDYAHHPTAIRETIAAYRKKYPQKKITVIIQPHTYSRLKYLFEDFKTCADAADLAIYTDVFASREKGKPTMTSPDLVNAINKANIKYVAYNELVEYLRKNITDGVVVFMGAGDIDRLSKTYLHSL
jgi:UDP-N-acetylmuramate--alanine ligase